MKLVIDIPDKMYETVQNDTYCGTLYEELKNGIPLSESEDCVSRQAVLDLAKFDGRDGLGSIIHAFDVEQLPPVTPAEKVGRWMYDDDCREHGHCSECGYGSIDIVDGKPHNYCSNCGCKMVDIEKDNTHYDEFGFIDPFSFRKDTENDDVLDKIRAEIEAKCCITVGRENDGAITLHDVFEIIDKYK